MVCKDCIGKEKLKILFLEHYNKGRNDATTDILKLLKDISTRGK